MVVVVYVVTDINVGPIWSIRPRYFFPIWLPRFLLIDFSGYACGIDEKCCDLKGEDFSVSSFYMKWLNRRPLPVTYNSVLNVVKRETFE